MMLTPVVITYCIHFRGFDKMGSAEMSTFTESNYILAGLRGEGCC